MDTTSKFQRLARWQATNCSRVCSMHFFGNEVSSNSSSPSYVPSIIHQRSVDSLAEEKIALESFKTHIIGTRQKNATTCAGDATEMQLHSSVEPTSSTTTIRTLDKEVEVYLPYPHVAHPFQNQIFMSCHNSTNNNICNAQTQIMSPSEFETSHVVHKRKMVDKTCGTNKHCEDKKIGPNDAHNSKHFEACPRGFHGYSSITTDQQMLDLCGVSLSKFKLLLRILPSASPQNNITEHDRLLIFLMKLKTGMTFSAISVLFSIHRTTATRCFHSVLQTLRIVLSKFVFWPDRFVVQNTLPRVFEENFKNCRVIIDCTEIKVQQPKTIRNRVEMYSNYKKSYTTKILIGCTPSGAVSFISKCFNGRVSDSQITIESGILDLLEPGDMVLADKGFPGIQTTLDANNKEVLVVMPPFLSEPQFSSADIQDTYNIARVRIHIERIIQRFKIYKILDKLTAELLPYCGIL